MKKSTIPSPYKFLDAYGREDAAFFFGRELEVEEAFTKIFQSRILLVYGASGTGKSSLIHCGLADKFKGSDWMPISIRRGGHIVRSTQNQMERLLGRSDNQHTKSLTNAAEETRDLVQQVFLNNFKPIYFIFDQFEELFIFGDPEEWSAFADTLQTLLSSELDLHFIFVIRGDYLEYLNEFEKHIPNFFDNRLRVEKMNPRQAERSILGPAEQSGIAIEEGFAELLLQKLCGRGKTVEPTFLQVYLDRLYREEYARKEGKDLSFKRADLERIGPIDDILAEFVDEQVFKMEESKLAWSILKCFVSLEGTKVPLRRVEVMLALKQLGSPCSEEKLNATLEALVSKRILKSADEEGRMELRHDSLALKIYERISIQEKERLEVQRFLNLSFKEYQKRGTLLKEEDLAYVLPHQRKLELNGELQAFLQQSQKRSASARRKARNQRIIGLIILLLALSSLVGWYFTGQEKERANQAAQLAQTASERAQAEKQRAEIEKQKAEEQEAEALRQALLASAARVHAEEESAKALLAREQALKEQNRALIARSQAQENAREALKQKTLAEEARAEEGRLRKLGLARQLALRAQQMEFPARGQVALQAYLLHLNQGGDAREAALYSALLSAHRGATENPFLEGNLAMRLADWTWENGQLRFLDENGIVYYWSSTDLKAKPLSGINWSAPKPLQAENGDFSLELRSGKIIRKEGSKLEEILPLNTQEARSIQISKNGRWIAWGQEDGKVFLYDYQEKKLRQLGAHFSAVTDLQFDLQGEQIASAGYDRMVQVWSLKNLSQSPLRITDLAYWVAKIQFEDKDQLWINTFEGHLYRMPLNSDELYQKLCKENLALPSKAEWQQWTDGQLEPLKICAP